MAAFGRYCCKSRKLRGDKFPAGRQSKPQSPVCVASIMLPRSPVSLSRGDEVSHIFYTKVACTAKRNFDHECKKTFSTASTRTGSKVGLSTVGRECVVRPAD